LEVRGKRAGPLLDTKVLSGWNGQMIAAYAVAGRLLKEPAYIEAAERAGDFVLQHLRKSDGRLLHVYCSASSGPGEARLNAYLDDHAYLVRGLLCLHDATSQPKWLGEARALSERMVELYQDTEHGGFFYTSNDHEKLFARAKDQQDSALPSGNSVAATDLVR